MCYEFDSFYQRARALEALRRKTKVADELAKPARPEPAAEPAKPQAPDARPETVPA
jgi:hypothetical protein